MIKLKNLLKTIKKETTLLKDIPQFQHVPLELGIDDEEEKRRIIRLIQKLTK